MPVIHKWLIPGRVMGLRWVGDVTIEELETLDEFLVHTMDNSQQPLVHFISHELDLTSEPPFSTYLRARCARHQRFGWYLIIQKQSNFVARVVAQMAGTMLRMRFRLVENEAAAWAHLCRIYPEFESPRPQTLP
jgi:hypothetical protein